jgi:transcriptional regulator with XRE-family HTH domain
LKSFRKELGLSQLSLAVNAEIAPRTLQKAERGENVDHSTFHKIMETLRLSKRQKDEEQVDARRGTNGAGEELDVAAFLVQEKSEDGMLNHPATLHEPDDRYRLYLKHSKACLSERDLELFLDKGRELDQSQYERFLKEPDAQDFLPGISILQQKSSDEDWEWFMMAWLSNREAFRIVRVGTEVVGLSGILPLTRDAYDAVRAGRLAYMDITSDQILPSSNYLLLESGNEVTNTNRKFSDVTSLIQTTVFCHMATMIDDVNQSDLRIISFGYIPESQDRLIANGFEVLDTRMAKYGFKLLEFTFDPEGLGENLEASYLSFALRILRNRIDRGL